MKKRGYITIKTKLCSALCQLVRYDDENAEFVRIIPHEEAKKLSEDEILSRFDFHHDPIPKAHDGPDVHWNLTPLPKAEHRKVTATITIPSVAKGKRIRRKHEEHQRRMLAKDRGEPRPVSRWPKRKLQSRSSFGERRA